MLSGLCGNSMYWLGFWGNGDLVKECGQWVRLIGLGGFSFEMARCYMRFCEQTTLDPVRQEHAAEKDNGLIFRLFACGK
jgi:hypothetical protein